MTTSSIKHVIRISGVRLSTYLSGRYLATAVAAVFLVCRLTSGRFGFGEFFKAQQKLQDILEACFLGVFDAPSSFLSLARTLEYLADGIEHLFDENSNPNSAILRSDNKQNAQQVRCRRWVEKRLLEFRTY